MVDGDGTFSAGASIYTGTLNGTNWEWTLNMTDMSVVTFGHKVDITPPTVTTVSIASGTLIPHGSFSLNYAYTDTESGINPASATGRIYAWNV